MNLSDNEKITYLANLVAVSKADQGVSPNETQAIEAAQKRIGARKSALRQADAAAQTDSFTPVPVGSFSSQVANLEDMVLVSLVDGSLDGLEKSVVLAFARSIGVTSDQLKLIVSQVKASLATEDATRVCPSCAAKVRRNAKFCPQCGDALHKSDKAAAVALEVSIPSFGVAIEFAESTASGFVDAVRKAKAAPEFAECIKGKKTWYMAAWPKDQISEAAKLVNDLKGMRNRKVGGWQRVTLGRRVWVHMVQRAEKHGLSPN